jgi:hypothetical protein
MVAISRGYHGNGNGEWELMGSRFEMMKDVFHVLLDDENPADC